MSSVVGSNDPLWFKDAVIYQVHVRTFRDANGDGIGDFAGLIDRLDYIASLGVNAVWVMPFYPSPLRDEGYDIADYFGVNPMYGDVDDVRRFIDEAHQRGLRVITELVINHTSDQHPWFQRARRAPAGSVERDFYVWSDTTDRYTDARIIFLDSEPSNWTWDDEAGAYFWHRFYHHQPDLNFDNPAVQQAVFEVLDHWLELGVDGFRLDAIPYLVEREGTTGENLPETHAFLKKLRARVDAKFPDCMFLAEANQWPEDTRPYFGDGDECHMNYNFPVMPRLYMAVAQEDASSIVDILEQTPEIPDSCQWAMFLRNHDELTLEMVTEEERDFMWRTYAPDPRARLNLGIRRRLAPLMNNDRRRIELLNSLLFSLPGTPVLYYGDELGMGDNIWLNDRDGVRTPMQWSDALNAGFSEAAADRLYLPVITEPAYAPSVVNVDAQQDDPGSLLNWMRRLIATRRRHPVLGRGTLEILAQGNDAVLAFLRRSGDETILVVANVSSRAQAAQLDLSEFAGRVPVEVFAGGAFPRLEPGPTTLTLPAHGFLWLSLDRVEARLDASQPVLLPTSPERALTDPGARRAIEQALASAIRERRWFAGKARTVVALRITEVITLGATSQAYVTVVRVDYASGPGEEYLVPLRIVDAEPDHAGVLLRLRGDDGALATLVDGTQDAATMQALLDVVQSGGTSALRGTKTSAFARLRGQGPLAPTPLGVEQSNSSVRFGDRLILKVIRRLEPGTNPEWEIGRYLTEEARFPHTPATAGALTLADGRTIAVLQEFVDGHGDGWAHLTALATDGSPDAVAASIAFADLLGRRTAELHRALAAAEDPGMAPRPFTSHYQRSIYQAARQQVRRAITMLERRRDGLDASARVLADEVIARRSLLLEQLTAVKDQRIDALRIRIHGDYHLGQVLVSDDDVTIIDFEGEPLLAMSARRLPTSPLRDVAGMLRSFDYAAHAAGRVGDGPDTRDEWRHAVSAAFLDAYRAEAGSHLLTESEAGTQALLRTFVVQKAAYEIEYELGHRPDWTSIPLLGMLRELP